MAAQITLTKYHLDSGPFSAVTVQSVLYDKHESLWNWELWCNAEPEGRRSLRFSLIYHSCVSAPEQGEIWCKHSTKSAASCLHSPVIYPFSSAPTRIHSCRVQSTGSMGGGGQFWTAVALTCSGVKSKWNHSRTVCSRGERTGGDEKEDRMARERERGRRKAVFLWAD